MNTVGILGLGIIGRAWARNYLASGVLAATWNRTPRPDAPLAQPSPEAVAEHADVLQIVVADPPAVAGILERVLPRLGPGHLVLQSSTIDPASSRTFAAQVTARGARYVEAPFTGSQPAAEARQTVFYLGGDPASLAAAEPTLQLVSAQRFVIGTNEQACALKLAMNLNIVAQMEALAEALTLARDAGIGDEVFFRALAHNASYSGVARLKEAKLRSADFAPQFSVKHMHKDMRLAAAAPGAARLPLLATLRARLAEAEATGLAESDYSVLIQLLK